MVKVSLAKLLMLKWLSEGPASGYELMKKYEEAFGRSSPGTIYPLLSQLQEKGFVDKGDDGKFFLTEKGRKLFSEIEERRRELIREARKRLKALADVFEEPYLARLADYLPVMEHVPPSVLEVLGDVEILAYELGEDALPVLEEAKKKLEKISGASSRR